MSASLRAVLWFAVGLLICCMAVPFGWWPPLFALAAMMAGVQFGKLAKRVDEEGDS